MYGKSMTSGAPLPHILRFAFPVLLGSLLQLLYSAVDSAIVGNFSSQNAMAAVGTTGTFAFLFLAIALGFSAGNGVLVSQYYGAGEETRVRSSASVGVLLLLGLGVVATVVGVLVARPALVYFVDAPDAILELATEYFVVYSWGLLFQFGYNAFASILRAIGDSASTLYFLLIASVANILLDLLFVAYFKWGVFGAAFATDLSQAGACFAAYYYMTRKYPVFRFKLREYVWIWDDVKRTLVLGYPIALQLIVISIGLTAIQRAANGFGEVMTASFTVGRLMEMLLNMPCHALQTTLATYAGQNVGARLFKRVWQGARQTVALSVGLTLVISAFVWFGANWIVTFFALDAQASKYCVAHLRAIAIINVVLCAYVPLFGVFQGSNHSGMPAVVASTALTIRCVVTYLFRYSAFIGYAIVWWNGLFGFSVGMLITWGYFLSGRWLRNFQTEH